MKSLAPDGSTVTQADRIQQKLGTLPFPLLLFYVQYKLFLTTNAVSFWQATEFQILVY